MGVEYEIPEKHLCKFWDIRLKLKKSNLKKVNNKYGTSFSTYHEFVWFLYVERGCGTRRIMYWTELSEMRVQVILTNVLITKIPIPKRCQKCNKITTNHYFCNPCAKTISSLIEEY